MSHVENARYRILSFKYTPVTSLKKEEPQVEDGSGEAANQNAARPTIKMPAEDLPSLSPLMTSLQEIEDDSAADQGHHPAAIMSDPSEDHGTLRTPAPKAPAPLTEFHFFGDLPAELRLKIWKLTFLPRAVELRSTRPIYSAGHDDGRRPQVSYMADDLPPPLPGRTHRELTPNPVAIRLQQPSRALRMHRGPRARPRALPHRLPARRARDLFAGTSRHAMVRLLR